MKFSKWNKILRANYTNKEKGRRNWIKCNILYIIITFNLMKRFHVESMWRNCFGKNECKWNYEEYYW